MAEQPTDAELLERLEAELKKLKVSDVLVQTVFTLSSLGFQKLGEAARKVAVERWSWAGVADKLLEPFN